MVLLISKLGIHAVSLLNSRFRPYHISTEAVIGKLLLGQFEASIITNLLYVPYNGEFR